MDVLEQEVLRPSWKELWKNSIFSLLLSKPCSSPRHLACNKRRKEQAYRATKFNGSGDNGDRKVSLLVPEGFVLKKGRDMAKDTQNLGIRWEIFKILVSEKMNPISLNLENFVLLLRERDGYLVGFGQLKALSSDSMELSSVLVVPEFRGQGFSSLIIKSLLMNNEASEKSRYLPVYLTTVKSREGLYQKHGFKTLDLADSGNSRHIPLVLRFEMVIGTPIACLAAQESLIIMKYTT